MSRRRVTRVLTGAALTAGSALGAALPAGPASAADGGTTTVRPVAEAWYRATPACALPTGCADLSGAPSPYSADTLHVGVAGTEEARTYLRLDLAALPAGTTPTGGTLLLPVATRPGDGTRAPETARLQACAVRSEVQDADGSFAAPPEADCAAASVPVAFVPATATAPAAFSVDVGPLSEAWAQQAAPGAVALLPAEPVAAADSWHVAFSDRTRTGEGVVPISAALSFAGAAVAADRPAPPALAAPSFGTAPGFALPQAFDSSLGTTTTGAAPALAAAPLLPAPVAQAGPLPVAVAPQAVVPVASVVQGGFRYPGVFLLPLLLAVAAGWLGRALTRDLAESAA